MALAPVSVQILDGFGMSYTGCYRWLITALLAASVAACTVPTLARAQDYASTAATISPAPSISDSDDDPQSGSLLTIHKRVDEVNVLFIATDKHG